MKELLDEADALNAYPNLKAIVEGTIAGDFRDWIAVRDELQRLLLDQSELMRKASDALESYRSIVGGSSTQTITREAGRSSPAGALAEGTAHNGQEAAPRQPGNGGSNEQSESVLADARRFNWLGLKEYGSFHYPNVTRFKAGIDADGIYYFDQPTLAKSRSWREAVDTAMQASVSASATGKNDG